MVSLFMAPAAPRRGGHFLAGPQGSSVHVGDFLWVAGGRVPRPGIRIVGEKVSGWGRSRVFIRRVKSVLKRLRARMEIRSD